MKKIKILSLTLVSLLILQATNTNCFFGNLSLFATKKPVKNGFKFQKLILAAAAILVVGSIITYFTIKGKKDDCKTCNNSKNNNSSNLNNKHDANPNMPTIFDLPKEDNSIPGLFNKAKKIVTKTFTGIKDKIYTNTSSEMTIKDGILVPKKK